MEHSLTAIRTRSYDLCAHQSDRVLPDVETRIFTTIDAHGNKAAAPQLAYPRSGLGFRE